MHENNLELLREEAQRLLRYEIDLLERMQNEPGVIASARADDRQTFDQDSICTHSGALEGELKKLENLEMVLAVVGTMKAGKSTTINAIVGTEVLPNRNRAMTALPTLIRHTPGMQDPVLKFTNSGPVNELIHTLHERLYASGRNQLLQELEREPHMNDLLSLIKTEASFRQVYEGADAIFWFLQSLNDLVRLAAEVDVPFPFAAYDDIDEMPVVEVEFAYLRDMDATLGQLTLLDTPGPNEAGQPHLRKMLKEQLGKASAVLAVLDFGQLKTDADAAIRQQLADVITVAGGKVFTLVNKFDQKDRHGDTREQTQAFVANDLLEGLVDPSEVFPVSARFAYCASRAREELCGDQPTTTCVLEKAWISDFAEAAFGATWEPEDLRDKQDVESAANRLWKKSFFSEPLEKVVRSAHKGAAAYAIESAAQKLIRNAEQIENFLGVRETALKKGADQVARQIDLLLEDAKNVDRTERETAEHVRNTLTEADEKIVEAFDQIRCNAHKELKLYFKEGKRLERKQAERASAASEAEQLGPLGVRLKEFLSRGDDRRSRPSAQAKVDFDPADPIIKLDNQTEARDLSRRIQKSVETEMKRAEGAMRGAIDILLRHFSHKFTNNVSTSAQKIADSVEGHLAEDGFEVRLDLPDVTNLAFKFSAAEVLASVVEEKNKTVTMRTRRASLWGRVCGLFGTSDWGWDEYDSVERVFEIDIDKVKATVLAGIDETFKDLETSIGVYIETPIRESLSAFFEDFKSRVQRIRADLNQSINDRKQSQAEQLALQERLAMLRKKVPPALSDSKELRAEAGTLQKAVACL